METGGIVNDLKRVVSLCMIVAVTVLSVLIVVLSRILGWDVWMIPIVAGGCILCWGLFVTSGLPNWIQTDIYGVYFAFLAFYYCIRMPQIYDCPAVIVIMIVLFAFTRQKLLIWIGVISSYLGIIFHYIVENNTTGLFFDTTGITRFVLVLLIVPSSLLLVEFMLKSWNNAEKNYLEKIKALTEENGRANNFLANVSHEVRTPVSAVIGFSHVLQKSGLAKEDQDKVRSISEAGHRVAEQISDILDFTEVDMNKVAVSHESYTVNSMINNLLVQLSVTDNYGLDLVVDIEPQIPSVLIGDETKVRRILWHLIRNGYKFTKTGGVYVHLYPVPRDYGINLVMEVKDTGNGMSEDEIDKSYEKFYQSDSGRARSMGGLGLGIPIVGGFVNAMGGVFSIESAPGEGTSVKVSIPQPVEDAHPGIAVTDGKNCVVAGFLGFMTTGHPKIREYYMEMITHLSVGLSIPVHRVQTRKELEKLIDSREITHLFVGTGEYISNRAYIDGLSEKMNVAVVADRGFVGEVNPGITLLLKPFYGTQVVNFLNHAVVGSRNSAEETVSFPGLKALVVDDERMNLIVAREIFGGYGMDISTAENGEASIAMCREHDYDVVFMDHMMPGMDGVEAMHRIKQNASRDNKEIIVIALTANAISSAREMFLSEGFDGFIPKPIEISELERVLKRVLPKSAVVYGMGSAKPVKSAPVESKSVKPAPAETEPVKPAESAAEVVFDIPAAAKPEPVNNESAGSSTEDVFDALNAYGINTAHGLRYCADDSDFYKMLLSEYAAHSEDKLRAVGEFAEQKNWKDYAIKVHSIKSTSAMIGADAVAEEAKALEQAGKDADEVFIGANHPTFMNDYAELMRFIVGLLGDVTEEGAE